MNPCYSTDPECMRHAGCFGFQRLFLNYHRVGESKKSLPKPMNDSAKHGTLGPETFGACSSRMMRWTPTLGRHSSTSTSTSSPQSCGSGGSKNYGRDLSSIEVGLDVPEDDYCPFRDPPYRRCEKELTADRNMGKGVKGPGQGKMKRAWNCLTVCFSSMGSVNLAMQQPHGLQDENNASKKP